MLRQLQIRLQSQKRMEIEEASSEQMPPGVAKNGFVSAGFAEESDPGSGLVLPKR